MANTTEFLPKWTLPPGQTISDILSARRLSRADFANLLQQSPEYVNELLEGRQAITVGIARRLHDTVGGSVAFWMTRDQQYRDDVARLRDAGLPWLNELPIDDMTSFGWIAAKPAPGFEVENLLRYFAVPSIEAWRVKYALMLLEAAFRTSQTFESVPGAVAAWIRQGERLADAVSCASWNRDRLGKTLVEVRSLTRVRHPERFLPKLQAATAACGLAVIVLPSPAGCRASGAVKWLSDDKALLLLSARHLTDDHLWFTFYHECAHLLLHEKTSFVDEDVAAKTSPETDANQFAIDILIPASFRTRLQRVGLDPRSVIRLAGEVGIAPGILVAQLQRMKRLDQNQLNRLKRRFKWELGRLVSRETA